MIESVERLDQYYATKQLENKANDPYYVPRSVEEMALLNKYKKRLIPITILTDTVSIGEINNETEEKTKTKKM